MQSLESWERSGHVRSLATVIRKSRALCVAKTGEAHGRCFSRSLDIATLAKAHDVHVELLRWSVVGDSDFVEHWAVLINESQVLDPTHVQVDGFSGLVFDVVGYPKNYVGARIYPSSLLLEGYSESRTGSDDQLPATFLWAVQRRMFAYDIARQLSAKSLRGSIEIVVGALRFCLTNSLTSFKSSLESRKDALTSQIQERSRLDSATGLGRIFSPRGQR